MKHLLEIKDLVVTYGAIHAVKGVSIQVQKGQIVSLVGSNGAGKSTLMKSILGIEKVKQGEIRFMSTNVTEMATHEIIRMGISQSPEGRQIFPDLNVRENLVLGAYSLKLSKLELRNRMDEVFVIFPLLKERLEQYAGTLSGGEQQMLAIGRALMIRPVLLLLDEPSLGISPILTEKIFEILSGLRQKGTAILLAEQNATMALEISDYGYVLELGKVACEGDASALLRNDSVRKAYLGMS